MYRAEIMTYFADKSIPDTEVKQPQSEKDKIPFLANLARRGLYNLDPQHKTDHSLYELIAGIIFREDKERYLCYQELPLILAHFEAFLGQTLTAIWESEPLIFENEGYVKKWLMEKQKVLGRLSSDERAELAEGALFEIFRKSFDACFHRFSELGLTVPENRRGLILAANIRNAIIHNGGVINKRYLDKLNASETAEHQAQGYAIGSPVPISYSALVTVYNAAVFMCQDIFLQVSKRYFSIAEPLKDVELVEARQNFLMPHNPLESSAEAWVRKFASADEALAEMKRLKAMGFSALDIILGRIV